MDDEVAMMMPIASTSTLPAEDDDADVEMPPAKKAKKSKKSKRGADEEDGLPTELLETVKAKGGSEAAQLADKLVDEYYALDYEDKVGDVKTRFKYAKVPAESFNLTPEEILLATDAELNSFMSLKKLAPYRQDSAAYRSKQAQKQRKKLKELRDSIRSRKWGEEVDETQVSCLFWGRQAGGRDGAARHLRLGARQLVRLATALPQSGGLQK